MMFVLNKQHVADSPEVYNELRKLLQAYTEESSHCRTYNQRNTDDWLAHIIYSNDCEIFMVENPELMNYGGFSIVAVSSDFFNEKFGHVLYFYVHPDFRGTEVGRMLVKASCDWLDARKAYPQFCTDSAGVQEDKLFRNLMAKYDFKCTGHVLQRGIP